MAFDLEAIRRKVEQLNGAGKKNSAMWKPKPGEYTVRLVPLPTKDGQPFKELKFYYNIGTNPGLLAPSQFHEPDPIQELITKLKSDGTSDSYNIAKKLYPKMRIFAGVVVRGEEDKGVQIWGFGKQVYQALLNLMLDVDYGDITDPKEGRDIKISISKGPGEEYAKTTVTPKPKVTKLSEDSKVAAEWLKSAPDVDALYTLKSYDELEKIIGDWLKTGGSENSSEGGSELVTDEKKSTPTAKSTKSASLDDVFEDLENG